MSEPLSTLNVPAPYGASAVAADFPGHPRTAALVARARSLPPLRIAMVYPVNAAALGAAIAAKDCGLADPVLIGPAARLAALARQSGITLGNCTIVDTGDDPRHAAQAAVALGSNREVSALMKGSLHTDELLGTVIRRSGGLRLSGKGRRLSHVFWFDMPAFPRAVMASDCVVNIAPSLVTKRDIIQNAFDLAHALGIARPKLAIVSAIETVNSSIPTTVEAAALCAMVERGEITGGLVEGPFGFDIAVSPDAARIKGIESEVAGAADILLMPNLEAGNMIYKSFVYMGGAECAGVILGATVPVILTSRADSVGSRIASCALASIWCATRDETAAGTMQPIAQQSARQDR
ncbi:MAG: bifunctional enoyl-CoA hydratase/phosphate acetyltransferase, partial [Betaproteobacteria bacterium]